MKGLILGIILIALDLFSKHFLGTVHNYGAAFGAFTGGRIAFIVIGLILLYVFLASYKNHKEELWRYGIVFICSGLIGNLFDRIFLGYVRDFITLNFWPVFNLADVFCVVGVILIIAYFWKKKDARRSN